ncbi:hypothetical protein [Helicobacter pylori]|uniref:HP0423 family protein n=1 Tax=Helicobacter pylori PZ5024 TaxID=1337391 RepID=T2T4W6_HELPX|nr:hypothetical protein [Helicobacter pylori]EQD96592.1 hypothetical protein L930_02685 [Helicobacter pylori PZ5004]EQD99946.1 hypothetical protein L931_00885 [Helicobacter pylori PZ5024]OOC17907.1 hypothetical protein BZK19_05285 [Helicobacter pylori]QTP03731.1 hypothetical protein J5D22_04995 [Helicobacter pylori]WQU35803.1 hypothetical protein KVD82_04985 [Helicobacter pylori]
MGFQNENKLELGASVKATINNKVVEAKVISVGFNRVTLRSEKGNEVSYAFNSEKFLKWFNHTPLSEVAKNHAESGKKDILEGLKIVTSEPSVKERTSTPKEKESKFKLDFDFADENEGNFLTIAELYANEKRSSRLGVLFVPMSYNGGGFQASLIILHALSYASSFKHHTDLEFNAMIDSRDPENCMFSSFDNMGMGDVFTFCKAMEIYALNSKNGDKNGITLEEWAWLLPKNQKEAKFVAQLLCDGGINKYDLTCAGLTENLLKDNRWSYGMRDEFYDDEGNVIAEGDEATALKIKNEGEVE